MACTPSAVSTGSVDRTSSAKWGAVVILGFGVFVVGTGEFVLAGLLPLLSHSLNVSIAAAGQIIAVFALTCAIAGPSLSALTTSWHRRTVLFLAVLLYLSGSAWTALAPSYAQVLLGQIVAAAGVGLFVPNATVTAASLVSPAQRGRAISVVITGFTVATALGAPLGTALGGWFGWRATMWLATGLAIVGALGIFASIPARIATDKPEGLKQQLRLLAHPRVVALLLVTLFAFTAVYIPYSYIGVIFAAATGGNSVRLAALMMTLGVIGTGSNLLAGALADRIGGPRVVAVALVLLGVSALFLPLTMSSLPAAFAFIACYGLAAFAITTPQQHRLIAIQPDSASVLISLNQAVLYIAIGLSGSMGGVAIEWLGASHIGLIAATLALLALVFSQFAERSARNARSHA